MAETYSFIEVKDEISKNIIRYNETKVQNESNNAAVQSIDIDKI